VESSGGLGSGHAGTPVRTTVLGRNQPRHHTRDTRAQVIASLDPRVVAHLPFVTSASARRATATRVGSHFAGPGLVGPLGGLPVFERSGHGRQVAPKES
jgi:hypothetical protein